MFILGSEPRFVVNLDTRLRSESLGLKPVPFRSCVVATSTKRLRDGQEVTSCFHNPLRKRGTTLEPRDPSLTQRVRISFLAKREVISGQLLCTNHPSFSKHSSRLILASFLLITFLSSVVFSNTLAVPQEIGSESAVGEVSIEKNSVLVGPVTTLPQPASLWQRKQRGQKDDTPLSAEAVRTTIRNAVNFLMGKQKNDGSWQQFSAAGDTTALVTLALLNAGEDPNDPAIRKAIQQIKAVPDGHLTTYFVSLRIMVLATADPLGQIHRRDVAQDVEWLVQMQVPKKRGKNAGGWSYGRAVTAGADASNSQFAILALHEASRMGVQIPQANWMLAKQYWHACFIARKGAFSYTVDGGDTRGSMTCAGISSLIIIGENLAELADEVDGDQAVCCGESKDEDTIEKAIEWISKNFSVKANPMGGQRGQANKLYYLYGMERAGRLAGRRFFGPHDWYRDGAKELIATQHKVNGTWNTRGHGENNTLIATSLALLFLAKGKRPVAIGKYKYSEGRSWDQHPKGVHYLTRELEKQWTRFDQEKKAVKLNWQTVKAAGSTVDDLLEAPVLFISGRDEVPISDDEKANLKKYLENGGFLFAEACRGEGCGDGAFDREFRALMKELFPENDLEALNLGHPIWSALHRIEPQHPERPLFGLQACCRTSVIYCPANLSAYWSLNRSAIKEKSSDRLLERIKYCLELGVNVVTYATGRELKDKGETPRMLEASTEMLTDRVLVFPKLNHNGGFDDAPNAWRNVLREVKQVGLRIKMDKKIIPPELNQLADHPFVFMHGRNAFQFNEAQRSALRTYLEFGGLIFADSICSSPQFTKSFREEMSKILGRDLDPIPKNHPIWIDPRGDGLQNRFGYDIQQVTLRTRDANVDGGFRSSLRPPELEGVEMNGRLAVIFSPNDLSCALENTAFSQCDGYTRDDAIKIGTNVILYSLLSDVENP